MAEYIEREAIMEFPIRKDHCDKEHANEHFIFGIESVLEYVENLPTADVAPVVHGRWMHEETEGGFHVWRCSRCGRGMNDNPEGMDFYCYHCGAKMDGGAENERGPHD